MNFKFLYNLYKIKAFGVPDRQFKKELWQNLCSAWQKDGHSDFYWYQSMYFRYAVVALVIIMVLGGFGTSAYAYANPAINENSILYPIKQRIEKMEEKIKFTSEARAKFYLKQLERREKEKKFLLNSQQNTAPIEKNIEVIEKNLEKANEWFEKKQIDNPLLKEKIKERLEKRKKVLEQQREKAVELEAKLNIKKEEIKNNLKNNPRGRADK